MNPLTNVWTKNQVGQPPGNHGRMGLWLHTRKMISAAFVPDRWQRRQIKGWAPYMLAIPDGSQLFTVGAQQTVEVTASCPVNFAAVGFAIKSFGPCVIELYDVNSDQALINASGPAIQISNLGGNGKFPFFLKRMYCMDLGNTLIATITDLSGSQNSGQIVLYGYEPLFPGVIETAPKQQVSPVWPAALT